MLIIPKINTISDNVFVPFGKTEDTIFKLFNDNFEVSINDEACNVMECRVSAIPFNRPWPGKQRQFSQSESAGYISFFADETVNLKVKSKKSFENVKIRPLSKEIKPKVDEDEVFFTLTEYGSYVLELDGMHNVLHIFFNPIKEYINQENATYFFGPGIHFPMIINLKDNDTVYIDKEAIVFGSIFSNGAKNVKIFGGGVIDNSCEERLTESCYESHTKGTFRIYNCEDIDVADIIFVNSSTWVMSMFYCKNISIDNVKIVGHWRYNTDGVDIVNSSDITIKNSFIRSFDDTISIKAIYNYQKPIENIIVDNCVLWSDWSKNCEIGIEADGKEYRNVCFKDCELIHCSASALSVSNGGCADMHDIYFENLNIELQNDIMMMEIQEADDQKYTGYDKHMSTKFVACSNEPCCTRQKSSKFEEKYCDRIGTISDVFFSNIRILTEDIDYKPQILINSVDENVPCAGFFFENIYFDGEKQCDFNAFITEFKNAKKVCIK